MAFNLNTTLCRIGFSLDVSGSFFRYKLTHKRRRFNERISISVIERWIVWSWCGTRIDYGLMSLSAGVGFSPVRIDLITGSPFSRINHYCQRIALSQRVWIIFCIVSRQGSSTIERSKYPFLVTCNFLPEALQT